MNADGQEQRWTARVVVNATGIQADSIRQMADPDVPDRMLTSRGVHLVLRANLCPAGVGLLLPSTDDGRVLFMLPFFGRTLVGTTDTACSLTAAATPSQDERDYLLAYVRRWFPQLSDLDVGSCWAGAPPAKACRSGTQQQPGGAGTRGGDLALWPGERDGRQMDHLQTDGPRDP